jgi:reversibly glycosylated polypeptide/UDP-arabinopyranose mutase
VPSNRPEQFEKFLQAWEVPFADLHIILVEDAPVPSRTFPQVARHVAWNTIDEMLGEDAWIISREDSAIRCFGFLLAAEMGADIIVTLDDDCRPLVRAGDTPGQYLSRASLCELADQHRWRLHGVPRWLTTIRDKRMRGIPYARTGKKGYTIKDYLDDVMINVGLWHGSLDYDAPHRLVYGEELATPEIEQHLLPRGQYFPMCGMNLAFRREALPLMYFPLMGKGQPYRRFDDIWCGIIAKKVCDALGWSISVGGPLVHHAQQSDVYDALIAEAPGIKANEHFWQIIDEIQFDRIEDNPAGCMRHIGIMLDDGRRDAYYRKLGRAIKIWANLTTKVVQNHAA